MAYEEAAQFLARVVPWPMLGGPQPEFFVNVHSPFRLASTGKIVWPGRACQTVREATSYIDYLLSKPRQPGDAPTDIFVCMSSQRMAKAKTGKGGRVYYGAARGTANVDRHKGFYIDIDVKPEAYATSTAAVDAFGQFIKTVDLPMPSFIVASGSGGFHVHWTLDEPIETRVWLPLSQALLRAMQAHGLIADYKCTTNPVQILRVPNTFNFKHNPPRPVELIHTDSMYALERIERALLPYMGPAAAPMHRSSATARSLMPQGFGPISQLAGPPAELVANQSDGLPRMRDLRRCCPFVEAAQVSGGRDYRQPLWYETAKIAFYTQEGASALHAMSRAYPAYTAAETQALWDRIESERTPVDMYGWPQCDTIQQAGAAECSACPWTLAKRTGGRSPLHFLGEDWRNPGGPKITQSPPTVGGLTGLVTSQVTPSSYGDLPPGYTHDSDGLVWMDETDAQGNLTPMVQWPWAIRNLTVTQMPAQVIFETVSDQRSWRPVVLSQNILTDKHRMAAALGDHGIPMSQHKSQNLGSMLMSFVKELHDKKGRTVPIEPFGWSIVDGVADAFVYGKIRYNCNGNTPALAPDRTLQEQYQPVGDLAKWRLAMKMINDMHRPELEAIIAAVIGSVFVEFTSERGVTICAHSNKSGVQKSTAMRIGHAFWGDPRTGMHSVEDTPLSVNKKMGYMKNIAVLWDEVKTTDELKRFMFEVSQGKSKGRLSRGSELQATFSWATLVILASNSSVMSLAATANKLSPAGMYRVFEFDVPEYTNGVGIVPNASTILGDVDHNFGCAGAVFAEWLGKNASTMRDKVAAVLAMVRQDVQARDAERFWVMAITVMLYGAITANHLGLADFDVDALYAFLVKELHKMRRYLSGSGSDIEVTDNLKNYVAEFYNLDSRAVVITDAMPTGRGNPGARNAVKNEPGTLTHNQKLNAHWAQTQQVLRISKHAFSMFLKIQHGLNGDDVVKALVAKVGAKQIRAHLGGGTIYTRALERVVEFDLSRPELQDLLD